MTEILSIVPLPEAVQERIESLDPSIRLTMAPGWFDGEIRDAWGAYTTDRYLGRRAAGRGTAAERDALLAEAEVVLCGFPVPVDLRARAPKLRWVHQTPAGASNLTRCDIWNSDVTVTTSRGLGNTLAIAEWVVASFLHFARDLHREYDDRSRGSFERSGYRPVLLAGKTACIVGAGGIGQDVGRLCAGLGIRVVGTRRDPSGGLPEGFDLLAGPDRLHELLGESTFVAICCQWTPETDKLIDAAAFAAMPDGAVVANVARGEVVDEVALGEALERLRGVALDVYVGEFEHAPPAALWSDPKVLITPHTSGGADDRSTRPIELFTDNLVAFLEGRQLVNRIDWVRGY